jgi:hypothetical protein
MVAEAKFDTWGGLWQLADDGAPFMSDYSDDEAKAYVEALGEATLGACITFSDTSFYPLTYTLAEEVEGITVENNEVIISISAVIGTEFTVNVTCDAMPDFAKSFTFELKKEAVQVEGVKLARGTANGVYNVTGATFSIQNVDLTGATSITVDGAEFTDYKIKGNEEKQ